MALSGFLNSKAQVAFINQITSKFAKHFSKLGVMGGAFVRVGEEVAIGFSILVF